MTMRKIFFGIFFAMFAWVGANAAGTEMFSSCGVGYVLATTSKLDGIKTEECQKLWCRDLENGKVMGSGTKAANGYTATSAPMELCDADNNCIECYGDRRWCAGEVIGRWNPEYGAYTRSGDDNSSYVAYQKGGCYAWRLEKPNCASGETAVLRGGQWVCAAGSDLTEGGRMPSIRRTGTMGRRLR